MAEWWVMAALGHTARLFADDSELSLVRLAVALGAEATGGPQSVGERQLLARVHTMAPPSRPDVERARAAILRGEDPLGEMLCRMRTAGQRRSVGAFYTPPNIVTTMVDWVLDRDPQRVVDAGCGSGRFAVAVARRSSSTAILAVEIDPLATILTRAALSVVGAHKALVTHADYATWSLLPANGRTAFIGNPPYVRHHDLSAQAKAWAIDAGRRLGHKVSGLSGLHAHFYLATLLKAQPGDVGCFLTSAEWLDVGYGSALRALFLDGLGGQALQLIEPSAFAFADVQTTAVIACFTCGMLAESITVRDVSSAEQVGSLALGRAVPRAVLADTPRWSGLLHANGSETASKPTVRLGSLARVHRGLVTGANDYFIMDRERATDLGLLPWCRPAITDGREILQAGGILRNNSERKLLLDVPRDVDRMQFPALDAYLRQGEVAPGDTLAVAPRYIASRRKPWWYLGNQQVAPIVAFYMARQAPAFALNPDKLALVNIGHGIFPIKPMSGVLVEHLCSYLNTNRIMFQGKGRTYQGGLEKFEPSEMENLPIDAVWLDGE